MRHTDISWVAIAYFHTCLSFRYNNPITSIFFLRQTLHIRMRVWVFRQQFSISVFQRLSVFGHHSQSMQNATNTSYIVFMAQYQCIQRCSIASEMKWRANEALQIVNHLPSSNLWKEANHFARRHNVWLCYWCYYILFLALIACRTHYADDSHLQTLSIYFNCSFVINHMNIRL